MTVWRFWLVLALVVLAPGTASLTSAHSDTARTEPVRTVLVIHAGAEDHPANLVLGAAIRKALTSHSDLPVNCFAEYLETDRFPAGEVSAALGDYIGRKYRGQRIDVVIAITDSALRFVRAHRTELFPDAAVVFLGLAGADEADLRTGRGATGVRVGIAYAQTLNLALQLHPSIERVFVVAKTRESPTFDAVRQELLDISRRVPLTYIDEPTVPLLLNAVRAIPPRSLILYIWHTQEEPGHRAYPDEIARLVAQAARVPMYGTSDLYIGSGVVGGVVRSTHETGTRVAEFAYQILQGTRAQDIPIEMARVVPIFDWRQVRRWAIDPSRLPAGSDIRFRTPTAWESYRGYIVATVIVLTAQLLLIAGLLTQRALRRRAEQTIRAGERALRSSYEQIRELAGRLINAQEAARAGVARELHDGVCQELAAVAASVSMLKSASGKLEDPRTQHAFAKLEDETLAVYEGIRRLSHELHPSSLGLLGLAAALQAHCREVANRHAVQVSFNAGSDVGSVRPDLAICLFRIAQESLRNAVTHGETPRLEVSLVRLGDRLELRVTDYGHGFDLEAARRNGGLGLVSIEERARLVGGDVEIVSTPGRGTTICVRVPADAGRPEGRIAAEMAEP